MSVKVSVKRSKRYDDVFTKKSEVRIRSGVVDIRIAKRLAMLHLLRLEERRGVIQQSKKKNLFRTQVKWDRRRKMMIVKDS